LAEAIEAPRVYKIHAVDYQCTVGRVFGSRVCELLNRFDREFVQDFLPLRTRGGSKVYIDAFDCCLTEARDFGQESIDH
jgi:hypothetical protein